MFKQVVFESLLGDGTVYIPHECKNAAFCYRQVVQHNDAVEQRMRSFAPFVKVTKTFTNESRPNRRPYVGFYTSVHSDLTSLRADFYRDGKKSVSEAYASSIGWRGLAWWYMDDGGLDVARNGRKIVASFSTDSFTKTDCAILQGCIQRNLGIFLHIHKAKVNKAGQQTYRMRVSSSTFDAFMEGIKQFVVPSFYYKLVVREAPGKYTRMKIQSDLAGNSESKAEMSYPVVKASE